MLFQSGFSYNITVFIASAVCIECFHFLSGDLTGVTDQRGKIFTVLINTDRIFFDIHARIKILVFHDKRHGLFAHIRCQSRRYIFLIAVGSHSTPHGSEF